MTNRLADVVGDRRLALVHHCDDLTAAHETECHLPNHAIQYSGQLELSQHCMNLFMQEHIA
ncbi:hypothetical protein [Novosphingobium pentaromativorans]|uniref:hypothetical protein n=1 Tax=Novosphingobium pentaromativorans TaxID=205844 RepID=UPI00193A5A97|nr:hypothetical protein [Novosphingobium pentaromativorans]